MSAATRTASYGTIMRVMGTINGAGFKRIGLVALEEPEADRLMRTGLIVSVVGHVALARLGPDLAHRRRRSTRATSRRCRSSSSRSTELTDLDLGKKTRRGGRRRRRPNDPRREGRRDAAAAARSARRGPEPDAAAAAPPPPPEAAPPADAAEAEPEPPPPPSAEPEPLPETAPPRSRRPSRRRRRSRRPPRRPSPRVRARPADAAEAPPAAGAAESQRRHSRDEIAALLDRSKRPAAPQAPSEAPATLGVATGSADAQDDAERARRAQGADRRSCWISRRLDPIRARCRSSVRFSSTRTARVDGTPEVVEFPASQYGAGRRRQRHPRRASQCGPYALPAEKYDAVEGGAAPLHAAG